MWHAWLWTEVPGAPAFAEHISGTFRSAKVQYPIVSNTARHSRDHPVCLRGAETPH